MEEINWNKTTDLKTDPRACCTKEFSPYNQVYRSVVVIPEVQDSHTILRQDMLPSKDTKYIIRYNMTLNGLTVTIPENCILEFDGGCITGGTLVGNDTLVLNVGDVDCILDNVTKEGTWRTIEYNKDETDAMLAEKADKADTYTKEEVDALIDTQDTSYDDKLQDYYTKRQSDTKYQELEDMIEPKADKDSLSDVAFSGRYDDLLNQPVIPSLSGYAKESWVNDKIEDMLGVDASGISTLKAILEDGSTVSGILTHIARKADSIDVYTKTEVDGIKETLELSIDKKADQASTYTKPDVDLKLDAKVNASSLAKVATSGLYSDLINKPVIPSAPKQANWNQTDPTALDYIKNKPTMPDLARVATSGAYNDLIGKPIFKTINGQTITGSGDIVISGGSSDADLSNYYTKQETYSKTEVDGLIADVPGSSTNVQADWNQTNASAANYIKNKPAIPTVPTNVSAFTNDAGYLTSADIKGKADKADVYTRQEIDGMVSNADKAYNPSGNSGLGVKHLRPKEDGGILTAADFDKSNTIYVISGDFDLGGNILTIPSGCVLRFDGGSISNGTIVYNNTVIEGFNNSYTNIRTEGKLDNDFIILEHYGTYPAESLTHLCTINDPSDRVSPVIHITRSITLEDDVVIKNSTQKNHIITIQGSGKETCIHTNGHHFTGTLPLAQGNDNVGLDGGIRFQNIAFEGTGEQGSVNDYVFDCNKLLRLYFDRCFISQTRSFLCSNHEGDWMQTISVTDCYCRNVDNLIYSIYNSYDIKVLNTTVESSINVIHLEGGVNVLTVKNCCIEGISTRPFYLNGNIYHAIISHNYFEYNGNLSSGAQVDLSDATNIHLDFSDNFIVPHPSRKNADAILLPASKGKLEHLDNGQGFYLTANRNGIPDDSLGGVLLTSTYPFRKFLYCYGNTNLKVNVPQPMDKVYMETCVLFSTDIGQIGYSTSIHFDRKPYSLNIAGVGTILNERDFTAEEMGNLHIVRRSDQDIYIYCSDYVLMQKIAGRLVKIVIEYYNPDYSNFISATAPEDITVDYVPQPPTLPSVIYPTYFKNVELNDYQGLPFQINLQDKVYHIKYDYDLGGSTLTLPENCTLVLEGGRITNGTIVGNPTSTLNFVGGRVSCSIQLNGMNILPDYRLLENGNPTLIGNPAIGTMRFDATANKPVWYNGTDWVDASGTKV